MVNITRIRIIEQWVETILDQYERISEEVIQIPIPVVEIAELVFGLRCDVEQFNGSLEGASGLIIPEKNWILINNKDNLLRRRFTVAHELAHWLIDIQEGTIIEHGLEIPQGLRSNNKFTREAIANQFAGALLIPMRFVSGYITRNSIYSMDISSLSRKFLVSKQTMEIRLQNIVMYSMSDSEKHGVSHLPPQNYNKPGIEEKDRTNWPDRQIISLDFTYMDHNLIRKILAIKKNQRPIYALCREGELENAEILTSLRYLDGILMAKTGEMKGTISSDLSSGDDIRFSASIINQGPYYERIFTDQFLANRGSLPILFRASSKGLTSKQEQLNNLSWYIGSTSTLNYRSHAKEFISEAKKSGKRVVVATGCFDLIHLSHLRFLKRAKNAGDILVVGIEADNRVRARKGFLRPVNTITQRVELMEAFKFVDFVFVIAGSPKMEIKPFYTRLHKTLRADILAVSSDDKDLEDKKAEIEAAGGKLLIVSPSGSSTTTSTLRKIFTEMKLYEYLFITYEHLELEKKKFGDRKNWAQLSLPFE